MLFSILWFELLIDLFLHWRIVISGLERFFEKTVLKLEDYFNHAKVLFISPVIY